MSHDITKVFIDAGLSVMDISVLKGPELIVGALGINILVSSDGTINNWIGPQFHIETIEQARTLANQLSHVEVDVGEGETVH